MRPAFCIVVKSPRARVSRLTLQTLAAVASLTLYTYGTVILASTTLALASDAIRTMLVLTASSRFGEMVEYWAIGSLGNGSRIVVIDVPAVLIDSIHKLLKKKARAGMQTVERGRADDIVCDCYCAFIYRSRSFDP